MNRTSPPDVSFIEMKAAIGSVVFLSAQVERSLSHAINRMVGTPENQAPRGFGKCLQRWCELVQAQGDMPEDDRHEFETSRDAIDRLRSVRNAICHCLVGIAAGDAHGEGCAALTVRTAEGDVVYSHDVLNEIMSEAASAAGRISLFDMQAIVARKIVPR